MTVTLQYKLPSCLRTFFCRLDMFSNNGTWFSHLYWTLASNPIYWLCTWYNHFPLPSDRVPQSILHANELHHFLWSFSLRTCPRPSPAFCAPTFSDEYRCFYQHTLPLYWRGDGWSLQHRYPLRGEFGWRCSYSNFSSASVYICFPFSGLKLKHIPVINNAFLKKITTFFSEPNKITPTDFIWKILTCIDRHPDRGTWSKCSGLRIREKNTKWNQSCVTFQESHFFNYLYRFQENYCYCIFHFNQSCSD